MRKQRMPVDQKRSIITATTLRPAEREQLEQHAAARGLSVSSDVRRIIIRDLGRKSAALGCTRVPRQAGSL